MKRVLVYVPFLFVSEILPFELVYIIPVYERGTFKIRQSDRCLAVVYMSIYIEEYWADQYSVKNKSEIKMFIFTVFQGSGAGIRKRGGNLWGDQHGDISRTTRVKLPLSFHHVSGSLRRNPETL